MAKVLHALSVAPFLNPLGTESARLAASSWDLATSKVPGDFVKMSRSGGGIGACFWNVGIIRLAQVAMQVEGYAELPHSTI